MVRRSRKVATRARSQTPVWASSQGTTTLLPSPDYPPRASGLPRPFSFFRPSALEAPSGVRLSTSKPCGRGQGSRGGQSSAAAAHGRARFGEHASSRLPEPPSEWSACFMLPHAHLHSHGSQSRRYARRAGGKRVVVPWLSRPETTSANSSPAPHVPPESHPTKPQ